jgi:uncharacterized protein with PQ loop repeat
MKKVILDDANQATIKFGRVGATASIKTKIMTLAQVEKEIKEKQNRVVKTVLILKLKLLLNLFQNHLLLM